MERNEYRVFWSNHGYFSDEVFSTPELAIAYGLSKCFEFSVNERSAGSNPYKTSGRLICSWGPIAGLKIYQTEFDYLYRKGVYVNEVA